tara:strand:- start:53 stop:457 length:405 start_codon:yes stop_codon:yes gene_type:complete
MPLIHSKDIPTITHLAGGEISSKEEGALETILGFQGYSERTLIDHKVSESMSMGDCVFEPGAVVPTHHHDDAEEMFYVFEGSGTAVVNGEEHEMSVGDVLLVPRGSPHSFRNETGRAWRMVFAYSSMSITTAFD